MPRPIVHSLPTKRSCSSFAAANNSCSGIDLRTLQSELTETLPEGAVVEHAVMGYNGDGPLGLAAKGKLFLWDVETLKPKRIIGQQLGGDRFMVSADGRVFSGWPTGSTPANFTFMRVEGNKTVLAKDPKGWSYNESWAIPNADGSLFLTTNGLYAADLEIMTAGEAEKFCPLALCRPTLLHRSRRQGQKLIRGVHLLSLRSPEALHTAERRARYFGQHWHGARPLGRRDARPLFAPSATNRVGAGQQ